MRVAAEPRGVPLLALAKGQSHSTRRAEGVRGCYANPSVRDCASKPLACLGFAQPTRYVIWKVRKYLRSSLKDYSDSD